MIKENVQNNKQAIRNVDDNSILKDTDYKLSDDKSLSRENKQRKQRTQIVPVSTAYNEFTIQIILYYDNVLYCIDTYSVSRTFDLVNIRLTVTFCLLEYAYHYNGYVVV